MNTEITTHSSAVSAPRSRASAPSGCRLAEQSLRRRFATGPSAGAVAQRWLHAPDPIPGPSVPPANPPPPGPDIMPPEIEDPTPLENPIPVREPPAPAPPAVAGSAFCGLDSGHFAPN